MGKLEYLWSVLFLLIARLPFTQTLELKLAAAVWRKYIPPPQAVCTLHALQTRRNNWGAY
jgi:hypothetical protein